MPEAVTALNISSGEGIYRTCPSFNHSLPETDGCPTAPARPSNNGAIFCGAKWRYWPKATDFALQPNVRFGDKRTLRLGRRHVESLVPSLLVSLSAGHLVMAAKAHHGIASDNSGCGVDYYDRTDPESPRNRPGQVRLYSFWGPPKGYEAFTSQDEYLRVLADTLRAKGWKDAAKQIDEIRKGGRT